MSNKKNLVNKNNILKNKKVLICIILITLVTAIILTLVYNVNNIIAYFSHKNSATNVFNIKTKYSVAFDANTGTGTMENQEISYNVPTNLTKNAFTKTERRFKEWNTSSDGTGTAYVDEAEVTNLGDITLYAQWEMNDAIPPTNVSFTIGTVTDNSIAVTATASDETGVKYLDFSLDGGTTYPSENRQTFETLVAGEVTKSFTFTGLTENTEYKIKVKATDGAGNSSEADIQTVTTEYAILEWGTNAISAINKNTALQTIDYHPALNSSASVTIPGNNNGGAANQTFTQSSLGTQSLKWYVLNADSNGVNLVSQPTSESIQFKDAGGYDNCLYYLKLISTNLFTNEAEYGVGASRVHALNLTDIKKAAEAINGSSYSWDTSVIAKSADAYNNGSIGKKQYTPTNKIYPQIYGTSTGTVNINNPMYDEEVASSYSPKSGDLVGSTSKKASKLTVYHTFFGTKNCDNTKSILGNFGNSGIGGELFNASGTNYWLASRCILGGLSSVNYELRRVYSGYIGSSTLCYSMNRAESPSHAYRVVVSIPGSKVNVYSNGKITLK